MDGGGTEGTEQGDCGEEQADRGKGTADPRVVCPGCLCCEYGNKVGPSVSSFAPPLIGSRIFTIKCGWPSNVMMSRWALMLIVGYMMSLSIYFLHSTEAKKEQQYQMSLL